MHAYINIYIYMNMRLFLLPNQIGFLLYTILLKCIRSEDFFTSWLTYLIIFWFIRLFCFLLVSVVICFLLSYWFLVWFHHLFASTINSHLLSMFILFWSFFWHGIVISAVLFILMYFGYSFSTPINWITRMYIIHVCWYNLILISH